MGGGEVEKKKLINTPKSLYEAITVVFQAVFYLDRCIEHCSAAINFKVQKAEAMALMGRYQEAQELSK